MDDKLKNMKLADDELDKIAGGSLPSRGTLLTMMCPKCHTIHELIKFDYKVKNSGKAYSSVSRYICPITNDMFYGLDDRGKVTYSDYPM